MKIYSRILSYAKPYSKFLIPFVIFTLLGVFFSVFQFALIIPLLNFLFNPLDAMEAAKYSVAPTLQGSSNFPKDYFYYLIYHFKTHNPIYALYLLAGTIVVAVIFTNISRYMAQRTLVNARTLLVKRLREALFEKINHLQLGYFTKEHKGDLISRMNTDVYGVEGAVATSLASLFKEPATLIGFFIALFVISAKLTLFTLIIIPLSAIIIAKITKKLRQEAQDIQESAGRLLTIIDETLSGMRIIRSFNATRFILQKFSRENDFYRKASLMSFNRRELAPSFSEASGVFVVACILVYGGGMVLNNTGGLTAEKFIAFIAIFSQIISPAKNIVAALSNMQQGRASGERILEILDKPIEIYDLPGATPLQSFENNISFSGVTFGYTDRVILENINFVIGKGKTVALVGPSGVGKSTIADLVPRFYEVNEGAILIDDTNIRNYTLESLRSQMSFVSQEIILFNDSIFNNVALGKPEASLEEVMAAAKVANAHDFIMETEDGYNTNIGDRGLRLSGGQRQRLSIARAVFKNPSILILDEATSALDTESERLVQDALNNLMVGRTTLVIAHRLSTIMEADEIIVLQGGKIVERGNHHDLIRSEKSIYYRLTKLQKIA